jgi:hypothetical protein
MFVITESTITFFIFNLFGVDFCFLSIFSMFAIPTAISAAIYGLIKIDR